MPGYWQLLPEVLVLAGAIVALFGELVPGKDRGAVLVGSALSAVAALLAAFGGLADPLFGGMLVADGPARFIRVGVAGLTAVWLLWLSGRGVTGERSREAAALAMFSASGGMLLAMSADLITLYMALELSTMPAYVLMGYRRGDIRGLEGALKYFLLSLTTSLIMLYGLSFVYGISGETLFSRIDLSGAGTIALVAAVLTLVGLFAKMSAAPFHYWTPDAYEGAPASSVAFVSAVPKVAGTAAMVRLVQVLDTGTPYLPLVLGVVAAVSMVLGNLAALTQQDVRRLMAYSGVAHSGYLLMGLAAGAYLGDLGRPGFGFGAAVLYAVAYAVPSMAVMLVAAEEGTQVTSLARLASRRAPAAWALVVWLLSLIGIPPLAGFFGKLYLFGSALDAGQVWLVVIAVLMSVVSAGYYFRLIREAFLGTCDTQPATLSRSTRAGVALAIAVGATFAMGIFASPMLSALGFVAG